MLALKVALAPCVIRYGTIAKRLAARPDADAATNPYRVWIAEYAGAPYQEVAAKAGAHLERLVDLCATPAREAELIAIFKETTRLEADFWEMGWRAGRRVEWPFGNCQAHNLKVVGSNPILSQPHSLCCTEPTAKNCSDSAGMQSSIVTVIAPSRTLTAFHLSHVASVGIAIRSSGRDSASCDRN